MMRQLLSGGFYQIRILEIFNKHNVKKFPKTIHNRFQICHSIVIDATNFANENENAGIYILIYKSTQIKRFSNKFLVVYVSKLKYVQ